jgi:hypothetical protein
MTLTVGTMTLAVGTAILGALPGPAAVGRLSTRDAVARAARYVAWYDAQLPRIVADEYYEQRALDDEQAGARSRVLESEVAWVPAPGLHDVLAVRDVHVVDGRPVQSSRVRTLLEAGPSAPAIAEEILHASAAYNLGPGSRNLNLPTFPLVYLRGERPDRLRWRSHEEPDGAVRLELEERGRSAIVRDPDGHPMRARGELWIDPASGRITRAHVVITGRRDDPDQGGRPIRREVTYTLDVKFEPHDRLGLWLPSAMSERYEESSRRNGVTRTSVLTGRARYTNYHRFETGGRVIER